MTVTATRPRTPLGARGRTFATSADKVWAFERDEEAGTNWWVTYTPTGQVQVFTSLPKARAWTATPNVLELLRAAAKDAQRRHHSDHERFWGRRAGMVLDGLLAPFSELDPDTQCGCGGYLAYRPYGVMVHVDVCDDELFSPTLGCPDPTRHHFCHRPEPVQCDHPTCKRPNDLTAVECLFGHYQCCGCCHGES